MFFSYAISTTLNYSPGLQYFDVKIGGLNETELFDLKQLASVFPVDSEVERYGAWSANFRLENRS